MSSWTVLRVAAKVAAVTSLLTAPMLAQAGDGSIPGAVRREGTYAFLFHITFFPGKTDEGRRILAESLIPAWRSAGVDVERLESLVGTRDIYLIMPLRAGVDHLAWEVSPQDAKAWAALAERSGGADEAGKLVDRFIRLVERQSQDLVLRPDADRAQ